MNFWLTYVRNINIFFIVLIFRRSEIIKTFYPWHSSDIKTRYGINLYKYVYTYLQTDGRWSAIIIIVKII